MTISTCSCAVVLLYFALSFIVYHIIIYVLVHLITLLYVF
ncbi:hypothetical protein HMPREF1584_01014 [Gardnerella vaginalis JCP8481A]|nr:hypothetical protein HMPREF1584_01014 [Gardnerella vaginalis JCP8481A]